MRPLIIATFVLSSSLAACAPEVGSEKWCENMAEQDKGDWTVNEAKEFAKSCIVKTYGDD